MAHKKLENLYRQAIPILYALPSTGELKFYVLLDRQTVVIEEAALSQDITDKETAGYVKVSTTTDAVTLGEAVA